VIQAYFNQTKALVDKYAVTRFVLDTIFRYDNARHRPALRSFEHKHTPGQVVEAPAPTLDDVLAEIVAARGWV
jgi:hypothetical protein